MGNNHHHFSDFGNEEFPLEGKKRKVEDILNIEILITAFRVAESKYNERKYLTIQFENSDSDAKYIVFSGSSILVKQMGMYKDKLPFYATIIKRGKFYTLS